MIQKCIYPADYGWTLFMAAFAETAIYLVQQLQLLALNWQNLRHFVAHKVEYTYRQSIPNDLISYANTYSILRSGLMPSSARFLCLGLPLLLYRTLWHIFLSKPSLSFWGTIVMSLQHIIIKVLVSQSLQSGWTILVGVIFIVFTYSCMLRDRNQVFAFLLCFAFY